jgi:hypothetical protein
MPGGYNCCECGKENACDCKTCIQYPTDKKRVVRRGGEGFECAYCGRVQSLDESLSFWEKNIYPHHKTINWLAP